MSILNYTTKVPVDRSVNEIQQKLVKAGATAVMTEYADGLLSHIAFRLQTKHGAISFRLPANTEGVLRVMQKGKRGNPSPEARAQATRVSWRIVKDWVEAQMAIIEAEMATPLQVFLPYAQTKDGTVYECFERGGGMMASLTDQSAGGGS